MFTLRNKLMPLVNLSKCLSASETKKDHKVIICEINGIFTDFKVYDVYRIHRISWTQMEPAPQIIGSDLFVGIVKMDQHLILLLDFEKVLSDVNPEINKKMNVIPTATAALLEIRKSKTILIAEDSHMFRELLLNTLHIASYNTISNNNGQQDWDKLNELIKIGKPINKQVHIIITDIEMPQIDGHYLIKRIKDHEKLRDLPVVIFSSLINSKIRRKGNALGTYAQITKLEIAQLITLIDNKFAI